MTNKSSGDDYEGDDEHQTGPGTGHRANSTSFKKGQSGNLSGRPKGSRNRKKMLADVTSARVSVTQNGRRVKKSKYELSLTQLVNKAAGGELKAIALLNDLMLKHGLTGPDVAGTTLPQLSSDDELVMSDIVRRIRDADPTNGVANAHSEESHLAPHPETGKEQDS
jgi:Family of unknown function (DUF5681)